MSGDEVGGSAAPDQQVSGEARSVLAEAREAALERIPTAYARALRLRDGGSDQLDIAEQLGVEPEAVPALLTIAEAKLAGVIMDARPGPPETGG